VRARVTCDHEEFRCEDACLSQQESAGVGSVAVGATGQMIVSESPPPPVDCAAQRGCRSCAALPECGWCLQTRRCVNDEPWMCAAQRS
jgi:hypothetical protein